VPAAPRELIGSRGRCRGVADGSLSPHLSPGLAAVARRASVVRPEQSLFHNLGQEERIAHIDDEPESSVWGRWEGCVAGGVCWGGAAGPTQEASFP